MLRKASLFHVYSGLIVNMASMDIERKAWKTIVLMIVEMIQEWKKMDTNESTM